MDRSLQNIKVFLFDLDGTLTIDAKPLSGVGDALKWLKSHGFSIRICTNSTTMSRTTMSRKLMESGLPIEADEVFSSPAAAVEYLRQNGITSCCKLLSEDVKSDFAEFADNDSNPSHIVIGDIGGRWDYGLMTKLFEWIMNGAQIIALHKGRYWLADGKLKLDIGAFITGLEYATGKNAILIGKPSAEFFRLTLTNLSIPAAQACMVGDDLISDVLGAQKAGIKGILVRTGKYRQDTEAASSVKPDLTIDSAADLPRLLA
ncbi:MAG: TIGR01458 family HAD-type hydrolase [Candidatus Zixiibacteriota bacterium]